MSGVSPAAVRKLFIGRKGRDRSLTTGKSPRASDKQRRSALGYKSYLLARQHFFSAKSRVIATRFWPSTTPILFCSANSDPQCEREKPQGPATTAGALGYKKSFPIRGGGRWATHFFL